jgi:hypothetical protein
MAMTGIVGAGSPRQRASITAGLVPAINAFSGGNKDADARDELARDVHCYVVRGTGACGPVAE